MHYRFIAVEGNIGSGKTTLASRLAAHYQATLILETFSENPFISTFYDNQAQNALPLELHFLLDRFEQLQQVDAKASMLVSDYLYGKSNLFAGVTLSQNEMELFKRVMDNLKPNIQKPDLLIYLHASISKLKQNIQRRGRSFEQNISTEYLEKVQNAYQPFLKQHSKVLMVEMNDVDFEKEEHFQQLVQFLERDYDFENHIFSVQ
ncbi:deoxynucleoside kinase [Taibaiella sp. KBW10]|uniref:deoxynucleoside kinase n=1 Tax=Taibaiella sp. KBW10 TaxID=2153357 RepID=UPI000F5AD96E|nr:deoxynucleoside kinase [Taibaiella sp. KBW10]RQO32339.1 deoxynucleoside kinase [Taibaiella sp. KBW10]